MHHQQNNNSQCFFCTVHIPLLLFVSLMILVLTQQLLFVKMIRYRLAFDFPPLPAVAADTVAAAYTTGLFFSFPPQTVG